MQADPILRNVKIIGKEAFAPVKNLGTVILPNGLTNIGERAFFGNKINSITIPAGVQVIGKEAFKVSLLTSVKFSEGLITIDEGAFHGCQIPFLNFPESLQAIGRDAFHYNDVIVSVTFPKNIQNIDAFAFYSCNKLISATFKGINPPKISLPFNNVNNRIAHIYVPKESVDKYKNDEHFKAYLNEISAEK